MYESAKRYIKDPFSTLGTQNIEGGRVDDGLGAIGWEWNFLSLRVKPRPTSHRKLL